MSDQLTTLTVPLPWTKPPLGANDRNDRRTGGYRKIAAAKEQAGWAIKAAHIHPIVGANIVLHWLIPNRGRRDPDNLAPTMKVCLDALVAQGILPDDSWVHVPAATCRIHPPDGLPAAMWLTLDVLTEYEAT